MKPTLKSSAEPLFLLAFGAHPDDLEFGCGAVVARETQAGRAAHFVVCSRGESGTHGTPAQRTAEAVAAAKILGATIEFADLGGDAHLEYKVRWSLKIARIIRHLRPQFVLAPTVMENQHPDHAVVGRLVRDATRLARYGGVKELKKWPAHAVRNLFYYAVAAEGEPRDGSGVLFDVSASKVLTAWQAAMAAHASQLRTRNYVELQCARARALGLRRGVGHAMALFPNEPLLLDSLAGLGEAAPPF